MKTYNWVDVSSSTISKVAYDEDTKELLIEFKSGRQYYYVNAPQSIYEDLLNASSKGKFFHQNIKENYGYGIER